MIKKNETHLSRIIEIEILNAFFGNRRPTWIAEKKNLIAYTGMKPSLSTE